MEDFVKFEVDAINCKFHNATWENVDFTKRALRGTVFSGNTFVNCKFYNTDLRNAFLLECKFVNCDFTWAIFGDNLIQKCTFENCTWTITQVYNPVTCDRATNIPEDIFDKGIRWMKADIMYRKVGDTWRWVPCALD